MLVQFFLKITILGHPISSTGPKRLTPHQFKTPVSAFLERGERAGREDETDRRGPGGRSPGPPRLRIAPCLLVANRPLL